MVFSYLTSTNLSARYQAAKKYTDQLTTPFPEFERIANNRPSDGIDPAYPKTTDGTTASIIRKTPRRVIQQLPTGEVKNDEDDWLSVVADFILTNKLLPYANEEYDLIQKCWTVTERGLTFGSCGTYTPFVNHDGYFCPDVASIYWGDLALQPGKKSGYACSYIFMRSWWQPEDIDALMDREKKLSSKAGKRGDKYESTWDSEALKKVKDTLKSKDQQATTPVEKNRNTSTQAIELVTAFQKGVGAKFYTFEPSSEIVVRTETNKDPRGKIPIDWMYGDIDGTNPLGRGIIELVGGLQNLIDSDMQMYQYNRALMLAPPVVVHGINKNKVKYVPNAIIDAGSSPDAKVEPLTIDTSAVVNYPSLYGLQKSQLLNLVASPDTSISSEVGNPGFSKTPAGVNQQKANISVDDNYVRKMFEAWFENWAETAINLYFAKRSGVEELQLDDDTANRLKKLAEQEKFDLTKLSDDNKLMIDYDEATPALKFRVDASTSKMKDDSDQLQALTGLLQTLEQNPVLQKIVPQDKIIGAWNSIVAASGVEDPEDLTVDIDEYKQQQEQAAQMPPQPAQQQPAQPQEAQPQGPAPDPTAQPSPNPHDMAIAQQLTSMGFSEDQIQQAIGMLDQGAPQEAVMQMLAQGVANG